VVNRQRALLVLAALAAGCEPAAPLWDGSATVRVDGTVRTLLAGHVDAASDRDGYGLISLRTVAGKDAVSSVDLEFRFAPPLGTATQFPRFSGEVMLIDGEFFRLLDEPRVGSASIDLVSVSTLETKPDVRRYEVHGTMSAIYVQAETGRTVEMTATF
jgi:hypothetical protein